MEGKEEAEGQKEELIARLVLWTFFSEKAALRRAGRWFLRSKNELMEPSAFMESGDRE